VAKKASGLGETPVPEPDYSDGHELKLRKESGIYSRPGAELIFLRHAELKPKFRAIVLGRGKLYHNPIFRKVF
jgi:hypothetical protein